MNRRDIDTLTRAIKYLPHHSDLTVQARAIFARHLANTFEVNCAGFDKDKFLKRCGVANEQR